MSVRRQQGSSAWLIVIAGFMFLVFGAMLSTFIIFPLFNGFTGSAIWTATTTDGQRLLTYVSGLWQFAPAILLLALLAWVWVHSRQ
jgi:hypothetical protein